ncbi:UNVERIFIED_CONTAM: PASTA domain-containing protein [Limosilactobacillus fermentum]
MTAKDSKLDKFIKAVDKLVESKGVSKLTKTLDKTLNIAGNAVEAAADVTNHQLDEHNKRHLNDVKVPDISGLSLDQTRELFATLDIKYALVVPEPDASFATAKVDIIVSTVPKANTVLSAGSFVKIYYLDAEVIEASKLIVSKKENRKRIRKEAAKALATKLGHGTAVSASNVLKATTNVTKKMTRHSKTIKNPKEITATIIDVPSTPDESIDDESK